jgi:hypothetical protein
MEAGRIRLGEAAFDKPGPTQNISNIDSGNSMRDPPFDRAGNLSHKLYNCRVSCQKSFYVYRLE